jgi:histidine triad (HIT) family protein
MQANDCIFCRIVAGTLPSHAVYSDAASLAFMDINPVHDGHCLVIPKAHYANLFDMPPTEFGRVAEAAATVARGVAAELDPGGLSLVQANGPVAGQSVFHLHIHILPRRDGDRLRLNWGRNADADPARIAAIAARLRARLGTAGT